MTLCRNTRSGEVCGREGRRVTINFFFLPRQNTRYSVYTEMMSGDFVNNTSCQSFESERQKAKCKLPKKRRENCTARFGPCKKTHDRQRGWGRDERMQKETRRDKRF